ncbi:MAG: patatin-like phospholipase family protein [Acidobacteria bacterium]|nr:patatin-like phospholipase family protein [Acidobacteriota bacterium]
MLTDPVQRRRLLSRITLFGPLDEGAFVDLESHADWVEARRGDVVIHEGDVADGFYVVTAGRLEAVLGGPGDATRVLGVASPGESIGEMAILSDDRRSATVRAVRDSVLMRFPAASFGPLTQRFPELLRNLMRIQIARLRAANRAVAPRRVISTIAVVPVSPGVPVGDFTARLVRSLEASGPALHLTAAEVGRRLEGDGTPNDEGALAHWLNEQEATHRFIVYEGEAAASSWTRLAARLADQVLLVGAAGADPAAGSHERDLLPQGPASSHTRRTLVLVHPDGSRLPSGTAEWLRARDVHDHHHIRLDRDADFARLGRALAGQTVGVVLSGGGARGFAHIGMLAALTEAGIPVDAIGGTSMGSQIAAQFAMGLSMEQMIALNRQIFLEVKPHKGYTIPLLALVSTKRSELAGKLAFGDLQLEDLWLPYYCVSSNLSTAEAMVHRTGSLWRATWASSSVPGLGIPVLHGNHLLVDGAVLNNLPTDVMRASGAGTVIAAEVTVESDASFFCDRVPTTWEVLRSRLPGGGGHAPKFPSLMEVVVRASTLHSSYRERMALEEADLRLAPPVDGFTLLDFGRIEQLADVGYRYAREAVQRWRESGEWPPASAQTPAS